jgi:uncharacterized protein
MTLSVHSVTARQVRAIASGSSTAADLDVLLTGQRSKSLAMLALVTRLAEQARHPEAAATAAGWRLLTQVQQHAPRAVEELLRYPAVGAWATLSILALDSPAPDSAGPGRLALVAAAAAIRGGVPCTIDLPPFAGADATFHLPFLGSVILPAEFRGKAAILRHDGERTEITVGQAGFALPRRLDADTLNWRALTTVTAGSVRAPLRLVIDDADPYRLPGQYGQLGRLAASERDEWRRRISGGWQLLARNHQRTATDVLRLIGSVTPLSGVDGAIRSVTTRHVFGSIALSLPSDDVTMAVILSHEVQHAKLSALMDLVPLAADPASGLFYAPWRPDPRPLASLLQGVYAHMGVARFWQRHRNVTLEPIEIHRAHVEFARWRSSCLQVARLIGARPELTRCGVVFVDGMLSILRQWRHEYVPLEAQEEADQATGEHRRKWGMYPGSESEMRSGDEAPSSPLTRRENRPDGDWHWIERRWRDMSAEDGPDGKEMFSSDVIDLSSLDLQALSEVPSPVLRAAIQRVCGELANDDEASAYFQSSLRGATPPEDTLPPRPRTVCADRAGDPR